jgi:hypothetical protein
MGTDLRLALALLFSCAATLPACSSTKVCTLVGCDNALHATYAQPVDGAYTLAVTSGGVAGTVSCPTSAGVGTLVSLDDAGVGPAVTVACARDGFTVEWTAEKPLGTSAPDAPAIDVAATVTPSSGAPLHGTAHATSPTGSQPNGPGCAPTCYTREAAITLAP